MFRLQCPYRKILEVSAGLDNGTSIDTKYRAAFKVLATDDGRQLCSIPFRWLVDKSDPQLIVYNDPNSEDSLIRCTLTDTDAGSSLGESAPILIALVLTIWVTIAISGFKYWYIHIRRRRDDAVGVEQFQINNRYGFLDCFRG